jgi:DNA polymerase elongation subunit (family B)
MCQDALKRICNGMYGVMASMFMDFFFKPVAIATCEMGRQSIQAVDRYLQARYGNHISIIYGDTDSLFVKILELPPNADEPHAPRPKPGHPGYWKAIFEFCKQVESDINNGISIPSFRPPMKMELEKIMVRMVLFCKKHYLAAKTINDPKHNIYGQVDRTEKGVYKRGLASERRDFCYAVRETLSKAYAVYTQSASIGKALNAEVLNVFRDSIQQFVQKQVPLEKLIRTVKYSHPKNYATKSFQKFLFQSLIDQGNEPTTGSRIEFIYRTGPEEENERAVDYDTSVRNVADGKIHKRFHN